MISTIRQRLPAVCRTSYANSRRFCYPLLFGLLLALAGQAETWVNAAPLNETVPGGTIPLGGTLPPPASPITGTGLVRVLHLAPAAGTIPSPAIDICTQAGDPVAGFTDLVYLEQSGYQPLPADQYDWTVATPGCNTVILDLPAFTLQSGAALTLLIIGGGNQPLNSVLLVDRAGQSVLYLPVIAK